jgi:hypothetical protein
MAPAALKESIIVFCSGGASLVFKGNCLLEILASLPALDEKAWKKAFRCRNADCSAVGISAAVSVPAFEPEDGCRNSFVNFRDASHALGCAIGA